MILATVGTQLPFPRLIDCLDDIAGRLGLAIFAQTADPGARPMALTATPFLDAQEYAAKIAACSLIVGHAGIGTILEGKRARKPLILFPRLAELGEIRSDHQVATARFVSGMDGVHIAWNKSELEALLGSADELQAASPELGSSADALIAALTAQLTEWQQRS